MISSQSSAGYSFTMRLGIVPLLATIVYSPWICLHWQVDRADASGAIHPFPDKDTNWNSDWDDVMLNKPAVDEVAIKKPFTVQSGAVSLEGELKASYGCRTPKLPYQSCNTPSPAIVWDNPPEGTQSMIVMIDQEDSDPKFFVHWFVKDIHKVNRVPPENCLEKGANEQDKLLHGGTQMQNSYRNNDWAGIAAIEPAKFRIVALAMKQRSVELEDWLEENPTALGNEIQHHLISEGLVLGAAYMKFTYPGEIESSVESARMVHVGADAN